MLLLLPILHQSGKISHPDPEFNQNHILSTIRIFESNFLSKITQNTKLRANPRAEKAAGKFSTNRLNDWSCRFHSLVCNDPPLILGLTSYTTNIQAFQPTFVGRMNFVNLLEANTWTSLMGLRWCAHFAAECCSLICACLALESCKNSSTNARRLIELFWNFRSVLRLRFEPKIYCTFWILTNFN